MTRQTEKGNIMTTDSQIIKTALQFVDPESGTRTPPFFVTDIAAFVEELKDQIEGDPDYGNYYCIILGYYSGNNELIDISTVPLLRLNSLVERFVNSRPYDKEETNHGE